MAADALVLPSYREGFGMVLIEAGAMSVPVMASNIIGCNEIVVPGKNGDLVDSQNENSLFEMMKKWIENPEYVNCLSQNSRNMVVDRYSRKIVWKEQLKFYKSLER